MTTLLDDTDTALADAARRYLRERYAFDTRCRLPVAERRFSPTAWNDFATMGWLALATPEALGGLGLRVGSIALLAQIAGRDLVNEPLLSSGVLAANIVVCHGSDAQREALLPALMSGTTRIACLFDNTAMRVESGRLSGRQALALDADIADLYLVHARCGDGPPRFYLCTAERGGVRRKPLPLLDGRGAATLDFDAAPVTPLGNPGDGTPQSTEHALLLAALACAADACGAMTAAHELTLEYLKTRRQFGRPIGSNQSLQHRAVDMYLRCAESQAVLRHAVTSLQQDAPAAARDVHAAKAFVCEQAVLLAQEAVQLHGGIGITDEYQLSHWLRRIRVDAQLFGSTEAHLRAFAALPS